MSADALYDWGLSVIAAVQQLKSPFMTVLIRGASFLGDPVFYLAFVAAVFWCADSRRGFRLGAVIIFSGALNSAIKQTLRVPRPFLRDPAVFIINEGGFSTPSGHSQGSAGFYPVAASALVAGKTALRRTLRLVLAVAVPLLVGFSRIYLGVHYPTDVLLGLALGFLTAAGVLLFWDDAATLVAPLRKSVKLLLAAVLCLALNHFGRADTSMSGLLLGFAGGYAFLSDKGGFDAASGSAARKLARVALGFAVVAAAHFLLKAAFSVANLDSPDSGWHAMCRFVRYCATGAAASYAAPVLFVRLNLAATQNTGNAENNGK